MVVAQARGIEFIQYKLGKWDPQIDWYGASALWEEIINALGLSALPGAVHPYLGKLNEEGEAFRQRFVDYTPPEETP